MLSKLYNIEIKSHQRIARKKLRPIINQNKSSNFSKTSYSAGKSLINNISLSNENRSLHRRINEKCSIYSISKWDQQYKKSREYKKNVCQYPSIDFCNNFGISKTINQLRNQGEKNIFHGIRFKPFISFDEKYKENKSNNNYYSNEIKRKNDEKNKREKERKKREEEKKKR